jgi:REP element-mobilizing transposase RayT
MQRSHRLVPTAYVGVNRHVLTICTHNLLQTAESKSFLVLAYCFMPDHLHALVEATSQRSDFREFVRLFKQKTAWDFRQRTGERLWQTSFFDRTLRESDDVTRTIVYIVNNPVRATLVDKPESHAHWGSGVYTRLQILEFVAESRHAPV